MNTSSPPNFQASFVIPVFNEQDTIRLLVDKISSVMLKEEIKFYEIIFIDDGSTDDSWQQIKETINIFPEHVKAIQFRKNFGKSAALNAGFQSSQGEVIFTMDSDLQDDPEEIPFFLDKLNEGFDLVSGWKKKRNDPLSKTLPSKFFNKVTSFISGIKLNDFNCGFKAYRKEVLEYIHLYGELHRFIPVLANEYGFKIGEIPVRHHPRRHGVSKYGIERYIRGFIDLLTAITITRYIQRPGHLFGGIGIASGIFGIFSLSYLITLWFMGFRPIGNRPLLLFGIMAMVLSVQLISFGLLAEISIRNNNPKQAKKMIKKILSKQKKTDK